jgi:hypothetical protein
MQRGLSMGLLIQQTLLLAQLKGFSLWLLMLLRFVTYAFVFFLNAKIITIVIQEYETLTTDIMDFIEKTLTDSGNMLVIHELEAQVIWITDSANLKTDGLHFTVTWDLTLAGLRTK